MKSNTEVLKAFAAAVECMERVAEHIPIEKRSRGVSPEMHVRHAAGHLFQHAKIARAALEKAQRGEGESGLAPLDNLRKAARKVVSCWSSGDLAAAVRELDMLVNP